MSEEHSVAPPGNGRHASFWTPLFLAWLLALGIYEDTGNLSFPAVTAEDAYAAGLLDVAERASAAGRDAARGWSSRAWSTSA